MTISWQRISFLSVSLIVVTILITLAVNRYAEQLPYRGSALSEIPNLLPPETKDLGSLSQ